MYVFQLFCTSPTNKLLFHSLSWADTAASTIGRLWGRLTPPLPHRVPLLGLPFAPRKSVAGFLAGSVVGASIAAGFWGWVAPFGNIQPVWQWSSGVPPSPSDSGSFMSGWLGLGVISVVSGAVSGIAEALGKNNFPFHRVTSYSRPRILQIWAPWMIISLSLLYPGAVFGASLD